jgi:hypothetical protein
MDPKERRRHPRFLGKFNVDLLNMGDDPNVSEFESVVPAIALDVSRQGMRLQCHYQVAVGTLLSAIVYFKGQGSVCLCTVVWKRTEQKEQIYGLFIEEWSQLDLTLQREFESIEKKETADKQASQVSSATADLSKTVAA